MSDYSNLEELDKHKIFTAIGEQPNHLQANYADGLTNDVVSEQGIGIEHLVLAGMGGSALAANIIKNWLYDKLTVPFEVVRGYDIPGYVSQRSVVIISSYSGNTEESLAALSAATKQNANIIIMSAGGKLAQLAQERNYHLLKLPSVTQPRLSVFAGVKALACLIEDLGLSSGVDLRRELIDVGNFLNTVKFSLSPDNDDADNQARELATKLIGKPVVIYGTPATGAAAYKWKIDINENAKQLAWYNTYPELNHNEFQGWIFPKNKDIAVVTLSSSLDHDRIKKRCEVTKQLLAEYGFNPITVTAQGTTYLQQLLYLVLFGDYVSAYMGILNGVDPTPVDLVENFKKQLD